MTAGDRGSGIEIMTFGCRLNAYELEVMRAKAGEAGLGELSGGAILVNTCAVTGEAVRQAKQAIRRARRNNPQARIIVTGCAAQTDPAAFGGDGRSRSRDRQCGEAAPRRPTARCPISASTTPRKCASTTS